MRKMVAVLSILLTVYEEDGGCVASTVDCMYMMKMVAVCCIYCLLYMRKMVAVLAILSTVFEEDGGCIASTVDCI